MTEPLSKRARVQRNLKRKRENEGEEREKKRAHLDDEIIECEYCGYLVWWNDECINCGCECPECGDHPYCCECDYEEGLMLNFDEDTEDIIVNLLKIPTTK